MYWRPTTQAYPGGSSSFLSLPDRTVATMLLVIALVVGNLVLGAHSQS